jgi:tetratricopeptide (TPR) repeat protein
MDEMVVRCHDLLASNVPQPLLKQPITALVQANDAYSRHSPASEYSEMLIDRLREANRRLGPHNPYVATKLALHLSRRCHKMHLIDDYEEAMALFDKVITSEPNGDCPGPHATDARYHSAMLAGGRAATYESPEYLEEAIYRLISRCDIYTEPPKNMASYMVSRGRFPEAIETLERGRALIWSEMRGYRTSIHQLTFYLRLS